MKEKLIQSIAEEFNIPILNGTDWKCQTVYSLAGRMALASLGDLCEKGSSISIEHFKKRVLQIKNAYGSIFPEIGRAMRCEQDFMQNEVYTTYLRTGYLYHYAGHAVAATRVFAEFGGVTLHRGCSPDDRLFMSGLGLYSDYSQSSDTTVAEMFCLQNKSFEDFLDELLSTNDWLPIDWPPGTEFLRLKPPFNRGYWQQTPDKTDQVSLARFGEYEKSYVFYRYEGGIALHLCVPQWRILDLFSNTANTHGKYSEYRRIAVSLLSRYETLPKIRTSYDGGIVLINIGYRLPPSEEDFFKLYSWPTTFDFSEERPNVFKRKMSENVFTVFKHELESIGYCFEEE